MADIASFAKAFLYSSQITFVITFDIFRQTQFFKLKVSYDDTIFLGSNFSFSIVFLICIIPIIHSKKVKYKFLNVRIQTFFEYKIDFVMDYQGFISAY